MQHGSRAAKFLTMHGTLLPLTENNEIPGTCTRVWPFGRGFVSELPPLLTIVTVFVSVLMQRARLTKAAALTHIQGLVCVPPQTLHLP